MKKGGRILLCICAASLFFLVGLFAGRNHRDDYVSLPQNNITDTVVATEEIRDVRLDINVATKSQLMDLPGVGETLADRIIAYRNEHGSFASTDDLQNVEGIGEKKLQAIVEWIKVGG